MKHTWFSLVLGALAGCQPRVEQPPPQPTPDVRQKERVTAKEYSIRLAGKSKEEVVQLLGPPAFTYSTFWRYDDLAWNEYSKKRIALYVRFDDEDRVILCD